MLELLNDYTLRTVTLGAAVLGAVSGTLGVFAVLRRQSLLGDAISHAALPGLVLAFLVTGSKSTFVLVVGAAVAGWLGTLSVMAIVRTTRIPEDSALGIVLSVFFGTGLVLLTYVQRLPMASQAGLDRFLFGQAATLLARDVAVLSGLGAVAVIAVVAFWKEFKLLSFDPAFAASVGIPVRWVEVLLTTFLVLAIVLGLQTVGVVLMSSMIVAPAAAARQWTDNLGRMTLVSALFGALAGASGALLSALTPRLPTGPTIVLVATVIVAVSLLFAPRRGLVQAWLRERENRHRLRTEAVLLDLWALAEVHDGLDHPHPVAVLEAMGSSRGSVAPSLQALEDLGLARSSVDGWCLTSAGSDRARELERVRRAPEDPGAEP